MDKYVDAVLDPINCISPAPDPFQKQTTVFRTNGILTITSSLASGHVLCAIVPQLCTGNSATFMNRYVDGISPLDVYSLPTIANLAVTSTSGGSFSQFTYVRLVSFQVTLRYIAAELTQAGECSIGFDNGTPITPGVNVKSYIQDCMWSTEGDSDAFYTCNWVPQDYTDFEYRTYSSVPKSSNWGNIVIAGSGFPVNIPVYELRWTAIVEGISNPTSSDYISRLPSLLGTIEEGCIRLFTLIQQDPTLVCSNSHQIKKRLREYAQVMEPQKMSRLQEMAASIPLTVRPASNRDRVEGMVSSLPYGGLAVQAARSAESVYDYVTSKF